MDVTTPQILVEAKVVEVLCNEGMQRDVSLVFNRHDEKQNLNSTAGIQTTVPGQTASEANKGGNFDWYPYIAGQIGDSNYKNFQATVQWLLTAESAKILSSPNVVVSRGATASIITGQDIPIQSFQVYTGSTTTSTTFKRVGVKLNVTPKLINNDYVMLQVNPEVSNVQRYQNIAQGGNTYQVPVIAIRNIETQLFLGDGQIVMIGGLYYNKDSSVQQRVPFLSDIPFMGELFTAKNDASDLTQLIFFLKINILADQDAASGIIYDPGKNAKILRSIGDVIKDSEQIFPDKNKTSIEKLKEELIDKKY